MNNTIKSVIIFVAGAGLGTLATWKFFEEKYKRISQEEINSVKESYSKRISKVIEHAESTTEETVEPATKEERTNYSNLQSELGYVSNETREVKEDETLIKKPYVISPEEFDDNNDYESESLTYYKDGVLTDDYDNIINDIESMVGKESLTHFGEYEDDSVYVRNEEHKIDYEILLDPRNYSDVMKPSHMYPGDDE